MPSLTCPRLGTGERRHSFVYAVKIDDNDDNDDDEVGHLYVYPTFIQQ